MPIRSCVNAAATPVLALLAAIVSAPIYADEREARHDGESIQLGPRPFYTGRGTLMSLKDSIALNKEMGVKHTPELKAGNLDRINAIFGSWNNLAQKMIDELKAQSVDPRDVFAQSFIKDDILYWIQHEPRFGRQAVFLDSIDPTVTPAIPRLTVPELQQLRQQGVRIFAPPMFALLAVDSDDQMFGRTRRPMTKVRRRGYHSRIATPD